MPSRHNYITEAGIFSYDRRPAVMIDPPETPEAEAESPGFFGTVLDMGKSVLRGAEEAAHDGYGLLDWATLDILPDWNDRRLFKDALGFGESTTTLGGVVEGISQFAAGFYTLGKVGKAVKYATSGVWSQAGLMAGGAAKAADAGSKLARAAKAGARGAITDFAFFDEHEERLSNILEDATIGTPVSEFFGALAAKEDDGVAEGRLKNVLEGLGLGVVADTLVRGLKKVFKGRQMRDAGASPQAVHDALENDVDDILAKPTEPEEALPRIDPEEADRVLDDIIVKPETPANEVATPARNRPTINPEQAEGMAREVIERTGAGQGVNLRVNPRRAEEYRVPDKGPLPPGMEDTAENRFFHFMDNIKKNGLNLENYRGHGGAAVVFRSIEHLFDRYIKDIAAERDGVVTLARMKEETLAWLDDQFGHTGPEAATYRARIANQLGKDREDTVAITRRVLGYKMVAESQATQYFDRLAELVDKRGIEALDDLPDEKLAEIVTLTQDLVPFVTDLKGVITEQARALASHRIPIDAYRLPKATEARIGDAAGVKPTSTRDTAKQVIDDAGGRTEVLKFLKRSYVTMSQPGNKTAGFLQSLMATRKGSVFKMVNEYWIESILSGVKTATVNMLSNLTTTFYRPVERLVGAGLRLDAQSMKHALREVAYLSGAFMDIFKLGTVKGRDMRAAIGESFRTSESVLFKKNSKMRRGQLQNMGGPALTVENLSTSWLGSATNWLFRPLNNLTGGRLAAAADFAFENVVRLPTKALQASDELFKQVNYRAHLRADLMAQAQAMGKRGTAAAAHVADGMKTAIRGNQAYSIQNLWREGTSEAKKALGPNAKAADVAKAAEQWVNDHLDSVGQRFGSKSSLLEMSEAAGSRASEVTFTDPLGNNAAGRFGKILQNATRTIPPLKFFIPFVTTPVNVLQFASRRVGYDPIAGVLGYHSHKVRKLGLTKVAETQNRFISDMLSGDPLRKADAVGRVAAGVGVASVVVPLAMNQFDLEAGMAITGRGPIDPDERAAWKAAGFQEYSIRVGDTYYSYNRLDPFAMMLGIVADITQYSHFNESDDNDDTITGLALAVVSSIGSNFTNKTYTQGISDIIDLARGEDENKMATILNRLKGSFVPNLLAQTTAAIDPELKEIRDGVDAAMSRTPWGSDKVEPKRDVLGRTRNRDKALGADLLGTWMNSWMPITTSEISRDPVLRELANTKHDWRPIRAVSEMDKVRVDLRDFKSKSGQTALDRYRELSGTIAINGMTLETRLKKLVESPRYKALPEEQIDPTLPSPRAVEIGSVIEQYRNFARRKMLNEYPEIRAFVAQKRALARNAQKRGQ
jgi:hypothetical protein